MCRHQGTLRDCVVWAKDRLVDDLRFGLLDDHYEVNYAAMTPEESQKFREAVNRLNSLLQLPDDSYDSLAKLKEAGYWNGNKDTLWEHIDPPLSRPEGITDDLMPISQ